MSLFVNLQEVPRAISAPQDRPHDGDFLAKVRPTSRLSPNVGKSIVDQLPAPGTQPVGDELFANLVGSSERLDKDPSSAQAESEPASPEETPSSSKSGYEPKSQDMTKSPPAKKREAASLGHGDADIVANKAQKLSRRQPSNTDVSMKLESIDLPIRKARVSVRARSDAGTVRLTLYDTLNHTISYMRYSFSGRFEHEGLHNDYIKFSIMFCIARVL
jgi:hypothetical protein